MTKTLKTTLILAICGLFIGWAGVSIAAELFNDNFDAYSTGNLCPQGDWTCANGYPQVQGTYYQSSPYGITFGSQIIARHTFSAQAQGTFGFSVYFIGETTEFNFSARQTGAYICHANINTSTDKVNLGYRAEYELMSFTFNTGVWYDVKMRFRASDDKNQICINDTCSDWAECRYSGIQVFDTLEMLSFKGADAGYSTNASVDDVYVNDTIADTPAVYLTTPVSGSTITDDSTELVGGWTNIDSTTWTNIKIAFIDLQIGETSGVVNVPITDDYGTFEIPLSEFAIPNNGGWNLRAIVENTYEYNFDIPNPPYNLIFDIEGYSTPYEFEDFETWYSENVEDYEEPSTWAMNLTGFMNPIFEKIGQFGNRINDYLDVSTGYEKGLQIGSVFPVVGAYVLKIDLFFGGFPMVQFFKWGILIMIGLFAVKIILKLLAFIPFIGGGG